MSKISNLLASFSFKKLLSNRKFNIVFSIFLAFVFWLLIVVKENPIIERSFANMTVNINLENTLVSENGMNIIGDISEQKFTVVVRGPTYLISSLKSEDFNLYASAASVDAPGEYSLEVSATPVSAEKGYEILSITPLNIKVSFDYIDTKEFTLKALAEGVTAKEGLIAENAVVSGVETDTVSITGPRSVINKIDSVVAYAKVDKTLSVSETFDADIKLYNAKGKKVKSENLTISETNVKVTVPISKKKTVPVEVDFSNLPKGFDKKSLSYSIDHEKVTIIGTPEAVAKTKKIKLSPINISDISKSTSSFDVSASLPEGIRLLDNIEHFVVKFNINQYSEKIMDVKDLKVENLGNGLKVSGAKIKNVKICGPYSELRNLNSKDIYAVVDLTDKKAGEHSLEVQIGFKDIEKSWAIGKYTTTITIK
ncbi:MAG: hypothetical protein E7537_04960 [Ruminococcaceae bacterium]|nr:hypothetical protein [Oscillospiraceae bacterium]